MQLFDTLSRIQSEHGYLPMEELKGVAHKAGLSLPEVIGAASFYSFFSFEPGAKAEHIENIYPCRMTGPITGVEGKYEWSALEKARSDPGSVIPAVKASGLTGRSGGGFPTGIKWELTAAEDSDTKYVVCNADEGEPGTGKDRVILSRNSNSVIEGMAICAAAMGAEEGYIYLRGEYDDLRESLERAISEAPLGDFKLHVCMGHGAYVCGEETALLNSIEGRRGEARVKPPYPGVAGLWGMPTVVNNVETFACVPRIISGGEPTPGIYTVFGCVSAPGVYETGKAQTVSELFALAGGSGEEVRAVLTGGGSGTLLPYERVKDMPFTPAGCKEFGASYGTASLRFIPRAENLVDVVRELMEFFAEESCGTCTPCRSGIPQLCGILKDTRQRGAYPDDIEKLRDTALHIRQNARCGLGQAAVTPLLTLIENFPEVMT